MSCEKRPTTQEEVDVCDSMDIEEVGVAGVRMANGWIALARDQTPALLGSVSALYQKKATEWCTKEGKKTERLNDKIEATGDNTCAIFDMDKSTLRAYCLENDRVNPAKSVTPQCSKESLGEDMYNEINVEYCNKNPKEQWCMCHNIVNSRCGDSPDGAGCRNARLDPKLADDAVMGQSSYDKLNSLNYCRRGVCTTDQFVPRNRGTCPEKFNACGKDFELRYVKNSDIIRHCVLDQGGTEEDLELLGGEVPDIADALKLQAIMTAKDENAEKAKEARARDDKYMIISIVMSCFCLMGMVAMASAKK
ncbi:hypothetical protein DSLPV1_033 [Dishui lake phycodnavirus 1]|uniref:hypothetical protein n=1 Tax=Dishui lake phycodnavirus 1 TaxID=2079134 RepID=UPI000CD689E2|nr:hypothetical protein C5Y57_gp033 [Dishui lake phycodnavirus 1]AUT19004.1 hypothetical protein DSLPV1_033 [Dishui lake phycodnavirus 1]